MYELNLENSRIENRYHIRRRMRCGSYTELFFAFDQVANQVVILKALNVALKGTPDEDLERKLIEYFRTEAQVLDWLQHPYIIKLLGQGTARDLDGRVFHYLLLEYMPGGDLMTLCRRCPLPLARALDYCHQVCVGLAHAHQHGIIHRDIKPQNLLLDAEQRQVKISDFGIAKVLRGEDGEITRGIGTETYAPPECFGHQEGQTSLTPAADVYGLAKTLYVMVTGEAPREFFQRPITQLPADIAVHSWAPTLLRIIGKATQHDPIDRYPAGEDFWRELEPLAQATEGIGVSEVDEETVIAIGIGQPQAIRSAARQEAPSAVRVEVPIVAPLAEPPAAPSKMARVAPEAVAEPEPRTQDDLERRRWTRRVFTTALAAGFVATTFWVHSIFSGRWPKALPGVARETLNLRAEPTQSAVSYGWIPKNKQVKIVGLSEDGQWYEVEAVYWDYDDRIFRSGRGWVSRAYVRLEEE
ncbi:MAG: protein kinase [Acidobacteria bacterium]|nr:protein kinase [Acidobacteriota bacterium]